MFNAIKNIFSKKGKEVKDDDLVTIVIDDRTILEEWKRMRNYKPWFICMFFDIVLKKPGVNSIQMGDITYSASDLNHITSDVPFIRVTEKVKNDPSTRQFYPSIPEDLSTNNYESKFILSEPYYLNTLTSNDFLIEHLTNIPLLTWMLRIQNASSGGYHTYQRVPMSPSLLLAWQRYFGKEQSIPFSVEDVYWLNRSYIRMLDGIKYVFAIGDVVYSLAAKRIDDQVHLDLYTVRESELKEIQQFFDGRDESHKFSNFQVTTWSIREMQWYTK